MTHHDTIPCPPPCEPTLYEAMYTVEPNEAGQFTEYGFTDLERMAVHIQLHDMLKLQSANDPIPWGLR